MCNQLLARSEEAVAKEGLSRKHLGAIGDLRASQGHLEGLRRDLLTAAMDKAAGDGPGDRDNRLCKKPDCAASKICESGYCERHDPQTPWGESHHDWAKGQGLLGHTDRRYVALEGASFYRANTDLDREELLIRAKNHAELQTSTLPAARSKAVTAAFVNKVASMYRPAPQIRTASIQTPNCADEMMFM
jgi:hypothetical protein